MHRFVAPQFDPSVGETQSIGLGCCTKRYEILQSPMAEKDIGTEGFG